MAENPFTEKDVELAAQAMRDANSHEAWTETYPLLPMAHFAEAALRVLAERGRLLPDGFTFSQADLGEHVHFDLFRRGFRIADATVHKSWLTDPKDNTDE